MDREESDNSADSTIPPIQGGNPALSQFIDNMGLHYEKFGVPRIGGRILGLLLVNPRPVSADEMVDALQVARSSISTNLRALMLAGLIERAPVSGERCDHFIFSNSAWQRSLDLRMEGVSNMRELASEGLDELDVNHPARQRLEEMIDWVDLLEDAYKRLRVELQSRREVPA